MNRPLLITDVEVSGRRVNVRVDDGAVRAISQALSRSSRDEVIEGRGGALLPGLHDHHLHLLAAAAALSSVDCGPAAVSDRGALRVTLQHAAKRSHWVRGVGYHESVAGDLDRHQLDALVPDHPVRIQHRSGALWMLNSLALREAGSALDASDDVERDERGVPTGRLWRFDSRLRRALPQHTPDLAALGRRLLRLGITGVTDATPDMDQGSMDLIAAARDRSDLLTDVALLGIDLAPPPGISVGPRKLLLRDHDLPSYDELRGAVSATHAIGRAVAVHCVTREALLLTLAVLDELGAAPGDRIEHAAVVPTNVAARIAGLGLSVVTQPDFIRARGDAYLHEVHPEDRELLYPFRSLLAAGVHVSASSDAPFGELDPWQVLRSAVARKTTAGEVIAAGEAVSARTALAGYLGDPRHPGGPARAVRPGAPANLCLLHVPLRDALAEPSAEHVRAVVFHGEYHPADVS